MSFSKRRAPPDYAVLVGQCVHLNMGGNVFAKRCKAQEALELASVGSEWAGDAYAFAEFQPVVDTYVIVCESGACINVHEFYKGVGIGPCRPVYEPKVDALVQKPVAIVEY